MNVSHQPQGSNKRVSWCYQARAGFTLLELMLVVALLGILATVGLSTYRLRLQQQQLQHTSQQMQQILQAAMAYSVDQNKWPSALQDMDFEAYLPQTLAQAQNPWQQPYRLMHPSAHRLGLGTVLPNKALAERLAASLPNAKVLGVASGAVGVVSEITVPGQVSAAKGGVQIIATGTWQGMRDGQTRQVNDLSCGGTLRLIPSLTAFHPTIENFSGGDPISELAFNPSCDSNRHRCTLTVTNRQEIYFGKPKGNGTVDVSYLVLCQYQLAMGGHDA